MTRFDDAFLPRSTFRASMLRALVIAGALVALALASKADAQPYNPRALPTSSRPRAHAAVAIDGEPEPEQVPDDVARDEPAGVESARVYESYAYTQAPPARADDLPEPLDGDRTIAGWDHFEFSMGFLAGQHRFGRSRWSGESALDPGLFTGAPFRRVEAYGLRYDLRLVIAHVRLTAGVDFPFSSYATRDTRRTVGDARVEVPELKLFGFHFGIGAEYPFGPVAPFFDILGGLDFATATITQGALTHEVASRDFGFRMRGGIRLHVRRWFFASLSGELGLVGQPRWAVELSVGFALMAGRDQH